MYKPAKVLEYLFSGIENVRNGAWEEFLFNVPLVRLATPLVDRSVANALLAAGASWTTSGKWTTSSAARTLNALTSVCFVSQDFNMYKSTFLFALSMLWNVDIPAVDLAPGAAEAAFGLRGCFSGAPVLDSVGARATAKEIRTDEPESLPWDTPEEPLPRELEVIWQRVQSGDRNF